MFKKNYLYLELNNSSFFAALLRCSTTECTYKQHQKISYKKLELRKGLIYNPTAIQKTIRSFLNKHNIKTPTTIVCLPHLTNTNKAQQPFVVFQTCICISKAGARIHKVISSPLPNVQSTVIPTPFQRKLLETQHNFFIPFLPPNTYAAKIWIIVTSMLIFSVIVAASSTYFYLRKQQVILTQQQTSIQNQYETIQTQLQTLKQHADAQEHHHVLITKFKNHQNQTRHLSNLLHTILHNIPPNTWLTTLKINAKLTQDNTQDHNIISKTSFVDLKGCTLNIQELPLFLQILSRFPSIQTVTLAHLEKMKGHNQMHEYADISSNAKRTQFHIEGILC